MENRDGKDKEENNKYMYNKVLIAKVKSRKAIEITIRGQLYPSIRLKEERTKTITAGT